MDADNKLDTNEPNEASHVRQDIYFIYPYKSQ